MKEKFTALFVDGRKDPFEYLKKHPVILTFLFVLALSSVTFCEQNYISAGNRFFMLVLFAVAALAVSVYAACVYGLKREYAIVLFFLLTVFSVLFLNYLTQANRKAGYIFIVSLCVLASVFIVLLVTKKLTFESAVVLLFIAGVILRFTYVLYTSVTTRQHDVGNFAGTSGHAWYIKYLYLNGKIPDFDVTEVDQFYHPPLHHVIAALWWKTLSSFGVEDAYAQSSLQTLTLFYSSVCMIISYRLLREFKVQRHALVIAFAIIAFHPTFVIFSASINNDILSVTFMLLAVLYSVKWYKSRKLSHIMVVSVAVGLGMMTKLSAYMVAFGIGLLFLIAMIGDKANIKKYILQYVAFLVVCVPLALWWETRNYIAFGVPPAYVQRLSDDSWQYVGNVPALKRLFDFSKLFEAPVFDQWTNRGGKVYNEYNPMISLLKTSCFGEYINDFGAFSAITVAATALFWSNFTLALLSVAALCYTLVKAIVRKQFSNKTVNAPYLSIAVTNALMIIFYYLFCFSYPHHCTENIRYISPVIVFGTLFIGRTLCDLSEGSVGGVKENELLIQSRSERIVRISAYAATIFFTVVFCFSSALMFLQMAIA